MPIEPEFVDFDVIKEDWNLYEIEEDKTIIKARLVLIKIVREDVDDVGNPIYSINTQNIFGVIPPKPLMRESSNRKYSPQEIVDSIVEEDLKLETIKEDWNEYKLKDGTRLSVKLVVTMVDKTSLFDQKGEPIYYIQSHVVTKASIPKELRRELRELAKKSSN